MTKRLLIALAALALASFAFVACGDDDEGEETAASTPAETSSEAPVDEGGGEAGTISVTADPGGGLSWTETELTASAGTNTVEMINDSSTPHNVVIEDEGGSVLAETDTVQAETVTTTAELEAGTYTYLCDVPGHAEAGMEGTLTVE